jgi:uncharacterized protein (TIGR01777 family)
MKVAIPGGTGQVGTILARAMHRDGHEVCVIGRRAVRGAPWKSTSWDGRSLGEWCNEIDGADVVINLAGHSVNCRYNRRNRELITRSRIDSTRAVARAIQQAAQPPRVWLQASTATIYSHRYDAPNDEATGILGGSEPDAPDTWRFSIDVAKNWEQAANEADVPGTRVVLMRSAMTMSPDRNGIFDTLLTLVRRGLGGTCGDGRQFVSWIHDRDFIRAVYWLIDHDELVGPVNLASPNPIPNAEFMRELRHAWGARVGLPSTRWMLELGTILLRTETELILKSRRVTPGRLLDSGFEFEFPKWADAASDLCHRWRANHSQRN